MNLNNGEEDLVFNQHCLELAKLLRTEQTEDFLHLYDSLPSEWNGSRLDTAKEYIRQLQELDENEFDILYQRILHNDDKQSSFTIPMSQLPRQSSIIHDDEEQKNNQLESLSHIQPKSYIDRITSNNSDEQYDLALKTSSSIKTNIDKTNTKTRRLQPITNNNTAMIQNNCIKRTAVDSFVQLNLKPSIDIKLEEYKKTIIPMPTSKSSSTYNRSSVSQLTDTNQSNGTQTNILKKSKASTKNKSHEEASFGYFPKSTDDDQQQSRSSSSSPTTSRYITSTTNKKDLLTNQTNTKSKSFEHSKLIPNNGFDSHGSSVATKSSSENSGSTRTGSATDSDDEQKKANVLSTKKVVSQQSKTKTLHNDDTPTLTLNQTSDNRTSQHDRISSLPQQDSYELVQSNNNGEDSLLACQVPRFKQPVVDNPSNINSLANDSYAAQRPQQNNFLASSHHTRNPEHHESYNTNHSNKSRKLSNRSSKKRKQEIIRTEFIPGHRGNLDVDELVMFIDGSSANKQKQRHNSVPLRPTDTNKFKTISSLPDTNSNNATSRRKSRKPIKIIQESINDNENKTIQIDEDVQSIDYIDDDDDDDDEITTTTETHSINNTFTTNTSLPNDDDESHSNTLDIDSNNDSNTTNGETSLPDWSEPVRSTSPINDDNDSFSLSSAILLNNSNSEPISEPFVTVTHRRRFTKERRQDNNSLFSSRSTRVPLSSNTNDKRRFQSSTQNGIIRSSIRNSLSNIKPFISTNTTASITPPLATTTTTTTTKDEEENKPIDSSPSSQTVSQISGQPTSQPLVSNHVTEELSPRLSSHSSSSSLPSLVKRQSKPPPVVFLNKSVDIELKDVSFGFDVENPTPEKPKTPTSSPVSNEKEPPIDSPISPSTQLNDTSVHSKPSFRRSYQQQYRNNRGLLFYSGTDIRPQQKQQQQQQQHHYHRNYPVQPSIPMPPSSYMDPLLFLQHNQRYSHQMAYMNALRAQYLSSQSPYVLIPATYATSTTNDINHDEKPLEDESNQTSEQKHEPLLVYATLPTQTAPIYLHPTKKMYYDAEQLQQSTIYPPQYYYSSQTQHIIPSSTAYFQPITSSSLLIDAKSQHDDTDEEEDNDYENSTRLYHQTQQQQSSSHIMSNALQLVYSQERRNAQTDSFNLDQLTSYLAMKWTDNINHYEQGDDEILLMGE